MTTATKQATTTTTTELRVPLGQIVVSTLKQPRGKQHRNSLDGLTESIKTSGVIEPIVVRAKGKQFEIICGERRFLASKAAGLPDIPAVVRNYTDDEARMAQLVENVQREDLHALDEAEYYKRMIELNPKLSAKEIARQIGKTHDYVSRRLSLNQLIPEANKDFAENRMTLGHALEISRLSPEMQKAAINQDGVYATRWDGKKEVANKENLNSVRELQQWINQHALHKLDNVPWDLNDPSLAPELGACTDCRFRTGTDASLFPDAVNGNICTNAAGYKRKQDAWLQRQFAIAKEKDEHPLFVSTSHYIENRGYPKGTLDRSEYVALDKHRPKCEFQQTGILVDSDAFGTSIQVCINRKCKDHFGHLNGAASSQSTSSGNGTAKQGAEFRKRKQEIFDLKVEEHARRQILRDALTKIRWPLNRRWLNAVAVELLGRLPSKLVSIVNEVLGGKLPDSFTGYGRDTSKALAMVAKMKDDEAAQLLVLLSLVPIGWNEYMNKQVSQKEIVLIADELKLNYALRDAEARMVYTSKKAKAVHESYLADVKAGKRAQKPSIFVDPKPPTLKTKSKSGQKSTKKSAKKSTTKKAVKK